LLYFFDHTKKANHYTLISTQKMGWEVAKKHFFNLIFFLQFDLSPNTLGKKAIF